MDATEKIVYFESYESLLEEIKRDIDDRSPLRTRYPVRFIMLNNFDVFTKFAQNLTSMSKEVSVLNIEDLLPADNKNAWITGDELKKAIRSCTKTTLVTPFSELVRFYKEVDFRGFFNEIMLSEDIDHPEKRIYIPLIGLQNRFENFLNGFARIEESAPVWAYYVEEHQTEVFLTEYEVDNVAFSHKGNICSLNTVYDWLRFWKNQAPQTQIICAAGPIRRRSKNSDPDNIFTFKPIQNAQQYLESFLGVNIPFPFNESENKYWDLLLKDVVKTGPSIFNFRTFVLNRFNVLNINPSFLIERWAYNENNEYDRWLLKNFVSSSGDLDSYPYLKLCVDECVDYMLGYELLTKVAERIFYFSEDFTQKKYAAERRSIIRESANVMREFVVGTTLMYMKDRLAEINQVDTSLAIALCTGVFDFEKVLVADWYAHRKSNGFKASEFKELCPELADYFYDKPYTTEAIEMWQAEYLASYRESKLLDEITEDLDAHLTTLNKDSDSFYHWYHTVNESHDRLAEYKATGAARIDHLYWIDALGAEFLPYIVAKFQNGLNGFHIVHSEITRCTIPSATSHNGFNTDKFGQLDELAHDKVGYKKYITLLSELKTIYEILYNVTISHYSPECTIAFVSDHGLSALSRKADSKKYQAKVEHDGRYIKVPGDGTLHHDSDYVVHVNEKDGERYKVALTYSSLGKKPIHEVHGGCMPEEVLVPFFIISNKVSKIPSYKFSLLEKELEISDVTIAVNIMPQPSNVVLTIEGKDYKMARMGSNWKTTVDGLSEGDHNINLRTPDGATYSDTIKVIGTGFNNNDFLDF